MHLALLRKPGRDAGLRPFKSSLDGKAIQRLQSKFVQTFLKNLPVLEGLPRRGSRGLVRVSRQPYQN